MCKMSAKSRLAGRRKQIVLRRTVGSRTGKLRQGRAGNLQPGPLRALYADMSFVICRVQASRSGLTEVVPLGPEIWQAQLSSSRLMQVPFIRLATLTGVICPKG